MPGGGGGRGQDESWWPVPAVHAGPQPAPCTLHRAVFLYLVTHPPPLARTDL